MNAQQIQEGPVSSSNGAIMNDSVQMTLAKYESYFPSLGLSKTEMPCACRSIPIPTFHAPLNEASLQ